MASVGSVCVTTFAQNRKSGGNLGNRPTEKNIRKVEKVRLFKTKRQGQDDRSQPTIF
jgi:hypothetical protein